jgi:molecular chaperone GrpE (heat shock protein)
VKKGPEPRPRASKAAPFERGDWRREALDDFASWLKEMETPPPAAPVPDFTDDVFSTATEVSALRVEVRRQAREQSKMNEELSHVGALCKETLGRLGDRGEKQAALNREIQKEIRKDTEKAVFLLFADLRDALQRGLDEVRKAPVEKGFFRRPPPSRESAEEGYRIALVRFDRAMAHLGIRKVLTSGNPFDPKCMVAIAARNEPGAGSGTVLEESLSGYVRGEEVLRAAHVVVASDTTE